MRIALVGYGRMGRAVEAAAAARGHEVVARIDLEDNPGGRGLVPGRLNGAEVAIEFTVPAAAPVNVQALAGCGVSVVCGTTGWYEQLEDVRLAVTGAGTGLVYAPNFSLGVQALFRLARLAGQLCDRVEEYDAHIVEMHHRHKLDRPSGTARSLANILVDAIGRKKRWELGPPEGPADPSVLEVTSVRAGEIPGVHAVALEGPDDRIEIRHEARGRAGFARGAVAAAEWIRGRKGVFTLDEMLAETWT
jgi:4-hydroxy-tetrahydrodipicolinate reductase